jgi:hypothetical protein
MKWRAVLCLGVLISGLGCSSKSSSSKSSSTEVLAYRVEKNGCKSERSFTSKAAYCTGLADDALNGYCAPDLRALLFENSDCERGQAGSSQISAYLSSSMQTATAHSGSRYEYSLVAGGCSTGYHSFDNKTDYCRSLLDESENSYCASPQRANLYIQKGCY